MTQASDEVEVFSSLAARLGQSNASLLAICHRVGINIFDPNYASIPLTDVQVQALTRYVTESETIKASESTKKKKKNQQHRPIKQRKKLDDDEPRSLVDLSEYFGVPVDELRSICEENDIPVTLDQNDLAKNSRKKLTGILASQNFGAAGIESAGDTPEIPITYVATKEKNKTGASQQILERATIKRIAVLAKELSTTEDLLRFVIDALQIRVIEDRQDKIEVRHETDIARALNLINELPGEINERHELKLKTVAARFRTTVPALLVLCSEHGIPTRYKRYVSAHGGLHLATLLQTPGVLEKLDTSAKETSSTPAPDDMNTPKEVEVSEAVNYQGVSLARQNFEGFSFENSVMKEVDLSLAILVHANLRRVDAREGTFTRTKAFSADFSYSDISHAHFDHADMSSANLHSANCSDTNFTNANFQNADLTDANFTGADVRWADFNGARFHNTTWIDGRTIDSFTETLSS